MLAIRESLQIFESLPALFTLSNARDSLFLSSFIIISMGFGEEKEAHTCVPSVFLT
jgi:hypothetical protein